MSNEMTPQENDDLRDLILTGAQRIRPARSHRALISGGVAVVVIAGIVGAITATVMNEGYPFVGPAGETSTAAPTEDAFPTEGPFPTESALPTVPDYCEPPDLPAASVDPAEVPAVGESLRLELDPCLTVLSLLGTIPWLEGEGIDTISIQGFQSVGRIQAWTADMRKGEGLCILVRGADRRSWGDIVCDAAGAPTLEQETSDGAAVLLSIDEGVVVARVLSD